MARSEKDYATMCAALIECCGGEDNVENVSHCMTRLRVQLQDPSKADVEAAKKIPGILDVIIQNGEYQFVVGQDVPSLYTEFMKHENIHAGGVLKDPDATREDTQKKGKVMETVMSFIGGTFSPVIPVLVAGGLTGAVLTILTTFCGVTTDSGTYTVIYAINQAAFWFLPIFIGYAAAQRLKSNGYLGAFLAAVMLYSTINGAEDLKFIGIPIQTVSYNQTVFPIILGVLFQSVVYKWLQKVMPTALRTIFVPLLTMLVSVPVTLIALGPIGNMVGTWLADGVFAIYGAAPALAVAIIGAGTCWLVFFGMNNATFPIVFALLAQVNSDPLICTGMAPANVAVGGACLAAAFIAKNADEKGIAAGAGITALCGITEPGVYGVLFTKKYPLWGAMLGGGIGGFIAGLFGGTQYVISSPGFISFAAYIAPDGTWRNFILMMTVMTLATVIAFAATCCLGWRAEKNTRK